MLPVRVQDERWEERFVVGRQHPGGGDETLMRPRSRSAEITLYSQALCVRFLS
jgi:hypothetical protein